VIGTLREQEKKKQSRGIQTCVFFLFGNTTKGNLIEKEGSEKRGLDTGIWKSVDKWREGSGKKALDNIYVSGSSQGSLMRRRMLALVSGIKKWGKEG